MSQENSVENFETSMEKLQNSVKQLESGKLSLEDSLKAFEEGVAQIRVCQDHLTKAEKKIEILTRMNEAGMPVTERFNEPQNS